MLLGNCHVAVVEHDGIGSLGEGRDFAVAVDIVALLYVAEYLLVVYGLSFGCEFVVASLGAYLGAGGDEDLEFGVGEDYGAYVAAVEYDSALLSHLALLLYHGLTYEAQCGDGADVVADLHGAYVVLDELAVEIGVGASSLGIIAEGDVYVGHGCLKSLCVDVALWVYHAVLHGIEGDAAIHGAGVDIDVAHLACEVFGHGALAAGGVAVYGYGYFFHVVWLFCCLVVWLGRLFFGLLFGLSREAVGEGKVERGGSVVVVAVCYAKLDVLDAEACTEGETCGV